MRFCVRQKKIVLPAFAVAAVLALASVLLLQGPKVFASHPAPYCASSTFPYGFFCPAGDTNDTANNVRLSPIDGTPGGGSDAAPQQVGPGATFRYETGYDSYSPSGGTYGRNVYNWVNLDIRDAMFDYGQGIRLYTTDQGPSDDIQYNDGTSLDTPMPAACGGDPNNTNFDCRPGPGSPGNVFNACPLNDYAVGPYSGINNEPGKPDGWVGCGEQGKSIVWMRNQDGGSNHIRYKFKFSLPDYLSAGTVPSDSAGKFCVRNHVSLGEDQPTASVNRGNDMRRLARLGDPRCYNVSPITLRGRVTSDDEEATGRPLPGVQLTFSNCEGGDIKNGASEQTNANGEYDVRAVKGARICISAPAEYTGPDGTRYRLQNPINQGNTDADDGYFYQVPGMNCRIIGPGNLGDPRFYPNCNRSEVQLHDRTADDQYDFIYEPIPVTPNLIKISNPGDGTAVSLGQRIDYRISILNNRDGNYFNVSVSDNIPLNMKQEASNVVIDSVELRNVGGAPPGWSSSTYFDTGAATCTTNPGIEDDIDIPFVFGYNGDMTDDFSCAFFSATNDAPNANPAHINVQFGRMPAYTELVIKWHGYVKDSAANIGVYPAAPTLGGYCDDSPNADYTNFGRLYACENFDTGLQGVSNFAYGTAEDSETVWSNRTYNPLPGAISSVVKKAFTQGGDSDGDGIPEYDPADPSYNTGRYTIEVTPDETQGPVIYQVMDQDNGLNDFTAAPLDPIINPTANCQPAASFAEECGATVKWGPVNWATSYQLDSFTFDVTFKDNGQSLGTNFTNSAKVCWTKYWEASHAVECLRSSASVERVRVKRPYFGVLKGRTHSGGGYAAAPSGVCLTDTIGDISANAPSYGQYVVSASGSVGGTSSLIGVSNSFAGYQCRPNAIKQVEKYIAKGAAFRDTIPTNAITATNGPSVNNQGYPAGGSSKVLKPTPGFGDVSIDDLSVTRRWTLYVQNGDLYIRGNIQRDLGPATLVNQPSLGIVVEGDVYIEGDVSTIDAIIFATGTINTCSKGPGLALGSPGGYSVGECRTPLKVNGALMANAIKFNRTTEPAGATEGTEAELVELIGSTYVLPPPGFTNMLGTPGSIRESRPRF